MELGSLRVSLRHVAFAILPALALLLALVVYPALGLVGTPTAPSLFVADAPFTRNHTVELNFIPRGTYPSGVAEWRASNDPTLLGGMLVNGITVPESGDWALAAGVDGPRAIYGQAHYQDGVWSPVASIRLTLETTPNSHLAIDVDASANLTPPGVDHRVQLTAPGDRIEARASTLANLVKFDVSAGPWDVYFATTGGPPVPGTYQLSLPDPTVGCASNCGGVGGPGNVCDGSGTFTIGAIEFTTDGDLRLLAADFRMVCHGAAVMSGSIRYGDSTGFVATDQSVESLEFLEVHVGESSAPNSVTLTNVGSHPNTLGAAVLGGQDLADYQISDDHCSGHTLAVGATCTIAVVFTPSERGKRVGYLTIADDSPRLARLVGFGGWGVQPTSVSIDVLSLPTFGPANARIAVTVSPDASTPGDLWVDDLRAYQPVESMVTSPPGLRAVYTVVLGPGTHHLAAAYGGGDFYLPATPVSQDVSVGTATSLELTTATDDGVAVGESADLVARLTTGGPIGGGTLRIRDGVGGPVLASDQVSGDDPSLMVSVTRGAGPHSFAAEFLPSAQDVQAATATYNLVVVAGSRPETVMDSSPLATWYWIVSSPFSSATPGATFECRMDLSAWYACVSPTRFEENNEGSYVVSVRARLANGLADRTPATRPWTVDSALAGTISIDSGTSYTTSPGVSVAVPAPLGDPSVSVVELSNDGVHWTGRSYAPTQAWDLVGGSGTKTVWARWLDGSGHQSRSITDTIVLDQTAPHVSVPTRTFVSGVLLTSSRLPVRIAWTGSDTGSGIARYEIARQTDGGSWGTASSLSTPTYVPVLSSGHGYRFRVRAIDHVGHPSSWAYGSTFRVSAYSQLTSAARYSGTWASTSYSGYWGGTAKTSSTTRSRVRFTFTGRAMAWISLRAPTRGVAAIYVNGIYVASVDLYAATFVRQAVVWTRNWASSATRTVEIRVLGTAGRPRVDIDGFWVGS
jgi:hypothetical protein